MQIGVTAVNTGITPAYAGKRELVDTDSTSGKDHPRLRGEKSARAVSRCVVVGSPPLTRGKAFIIV